MQRLLVRLRAVIIVLIAAAIVYAVGGLLVALIPGVEDATVRAMPWPSFLPFWPVGALVLAAVVVAVTDVALTTVARRRKKRLTAMRSVEAAGWLDASEARAAAVSGVKLTRITGFRARARSPHVVELSWNPPLDAVDEVVVYRSTAGFAIHPEPGGEQVLVCRTVEVTHTDAGLEDERLYHYTAFAHGRDGRWSTPSWAWAATPSVPLSSTIMGTMRTLRQGNLDF